ncbi:unnamed protein product [Parnassius apollo]|uniref:(apollo) hypothetical protein n=1 Tax=Parnassius apollo TaxID=110799 RepID=A0A8S3XJQ3_PARAO|nr:unnamed protein product [Parnassius apollo]
MWLMCGGWRQVPMTACPLLACGAEQHCGVFWQLLAAAPAQRLRARHILAAGGRYDEAVEALGEGARLAGRGAWRGAAVGFSLSLQRAATLLHATTQHTHAQWSSAELPVLVSVGGSGGEGGAELAREVWARGLRCELWPEEGQWEEQGEAQGEAEEAVRDIFPAGMLLRQLADSVRLDIWEGSKSRELVLAPADALEALRQRLRPAPDANRSSSWSESEKPGALSVLVSFVTGEEKLTKNQRRQIENQASAMVASRVSWAAGARRACVLALAADAPRLAALAARLPAAPRAPLPPVPHPPPELFAKRTEIWEEAHAELARLLRGGGEPPLLALYSIPDNTCRLLL